MFAARGCSSKSLYLEVYSVFGRGVKVVTLSGVLLWCVCSFLEGRGLMDIARLT